MLYLKRFVLSISQRPGNVQYDGYFGFIEGTRLRAAAPGIVNAPSLT